MPYPAKNIKTIVGTPEESQPDLQLESKYNPLVRITLAIAGLLAVSLSGNILQLVYVAVAFLLLCLFLRLHFKSMWRSIRIMLPWTLIFFTIHLGFAYYTSPQLGLGFVIKDELIVLLRFIGLTGVMGILRDGLDAQALVDSIKTLIDRLRIRSRRAEDFLQTLRLILVFVPQIMEEYRNLEQLNSALGFTAPNTLKDKIKFYGGNLLPVMSRSLGRARQLGAVMSLRGYGLAVPRGQLTPLPLRLQDGMAIAIISALLGSAGCVF